MHCLQRDPQPPACLAQYRHGQHLWSMASPTPAERADIRERLSAMQGDRCAYCEVALDPDNWHVEHFQQRNRCPQGTFAWPNLFGSCNRTGTCGDHKDKCGHYAPAVLVKPDVDNPDDFFVFAPDGNVSPRKGLQSDPHHRAVETIRIFNLNGPQGALRQIRYREVAGYVQTAEAFADMAAEFPEHEWLPLLQEELDNTAHLPFATAIRHVLTRTHAID
jgi:uncharacterized protein (TIGR02646 family)